MLGEHLEANTTDTAVSTAIPHSWQEHVKIISAAWQKGVASIVETGAALVRAKLELDHGAFEAMVQIKLPFAPRTARALMTIARHPVISNRQHVAVLPSSWGTLAELAKLPAPLLTAKIKDGTITPKLERKGVCALLPPTTPKPSEPNAPANGDGAQPKPKPKRRDATDVVANCVFYVEEYVRGAITQLDPEERLGLFNQIETALRAIKAEAAGVDLDETAASTERWSES
jgi:hypothetical protein